MRRTESIGVASQCIEANLVQFVVHASRLREAQLQLTEVLVPELPSIDRVHTQNAAYGGSKEDYVQIQE